MFNIIKKINNDIYEDKKIERIFRLTKFSEYDKLIKGLLQSLIGLNWEGWFDLEKTKAKKQKKSLEYAGSQFREAL